MALPFVDEQLEEVCRAWGLPRTPETLAEIERAIGRVVEDMRRGSLGAVDTLPSALARAEARRRFELAGPAPGVEIISGTGA